MLPSNLPTLLKVAGLKVVEIDGWQTRARPASTGGFAPVGVLNHHTGSPDVLGDATDDLSYATWLANVGRDDLPPPLVQLSLSLEGVVYIIAAGRSNHAGVARASGSVAGGDGNVLYCGIEWMLSGTQVIPAPMMAAGVTLNAVLLHIFGTSEQAVSCHYQTSVTGKWDIGDPNGIPFNGHKVLDVTKFREAIKARTASLYKPVGVPPVATNPTKPPVHARGIKVQIVKRTELNGTIDGHNPLVVTFRIHGPQGWFRLTVVTVNWGRGYKPGEFHANVMAVLDKTDEKQYVVLLMQEIDEADLAPEHKIIMGEMEQGTTFVHWEAREPIAVSPGVPVRRERKVETMGSGLSFGGPRGTGPARFFISCVAEIEGVTIGFGNQHPHRVDPRWSASEKAKVEKARDQGYVVTRNEVKLLVALCDITIYGGDMNDPDYPHAHKNEKTAYEVGLDTIRYVVG